MKNLLFWGIMLFSLFSVSCVNVKVKSPELVKDLYENGENNCVYIVENGKYVPFLVVDRDYGGNVLLLRQEPLESPMAFSTYDSQYEYSDIDRYLNNEYLPSLTDSNLVIAASAIHVADDASIGTAGQGTKEITRMVFLLSYTELGFDDSVNAAHEGEPLKYFKKPERRIAYVNGQPAGWWLRSPDTYYSSCVYYISQNSTIEICNAYDENMVRPAFCIPADAALQKRDDIIKDKTIFILSD